MDLILGQRRDVAPELRSSKMNHYVPRVACKHRIFVCLFHGFYSGPPVQLSVKFALPRHLGDALRSQELKQTLGSLCDLFVRSLPTCSRCPVCVTSLFQGWHSASVTSPPPHTYIQQICSYQIVRTGSWGQRGEVTCPQLLVSPSFLLSYLNWPKDREEQGSRDHNAAFVDAKVMIFHKMTWIIYLNEFIHPFMLCISSDWRLIIPPCITCTSFIL